MALRAQRHRGAVRPEASQADRDEERIVTTVHPHDLAGLHGARIAIGQRVPGCRWRYYPWAEHDPIGVLWFLDPWGSSAKLTHTTPNATDDEFPVIQRGPRRLWNEVLDAYEWWVHQGKPAADRWRFTVTPSAALVVAGMARSHGHDRSGAVPPGPALLTRNTQRPRAEPPRARRRAQAVQGSGQGPVVIVTPLDAASTGGAG